MDPFWEEGLDAGGMRVGMEDVDGETSSGELRS